MPDHSALEQRWDALWSGIASVRGSFAPGPHPPPPAFAPIAAAYSAPGRHYHNLDHIQHCLAELDAAVASGLGENPVAVELALWFHDLVYDPRAADNEDQSARAAAVALKEFGAPWDDVVPRLIIDTKHDRPPRTADGRLIADVDLSTLGQSPDVFDAYDRAIRLEYAHVPDDAFAAGRAKVLRGFLDRPTIYSTEFFRQRYERSARENLDRAIERWEDRRP